VHTHIYTYASSASTKTEREREREREKGKSKMHTGQTDRQTGKKHEDGQIVKADNDGRE